jgi:hypothetical protein
LALVAGLTVVGSAGARQSTAPDAPQAPQAPIVAPAVLSRRCRARPAPAPQQPVPNPVQAAPKPTPKPAAVLTPAKPPEPIKRGARRSPSSRRWTRSRPRRCAFEAPIGQPIRYKTLIFTVRACETSAPDEVAPESAAYVVVDTQPKAVAGRVAPPGRQVYKGWMYANSPGLNPLQHPVYDAWLIACKTSAPVVPVAKP